MPTSIQFVKVINGSVVHNCLLCLQPSTIKFSHDLKSNIEGEIFHQTEIEIVAK